jgi:hypothetical protein
MQPGPDNTQFESFGYHSPPDAEKLLVAFEAAGIRYRTDCLDGTSTMAPIIAATGGRFGQAAQVLISIDPANREDVGKIYSELFGDGLPDYDSLFFKEQRHLDPEDRDGITQTVSLLGSSDRSASDGRPSLFVLIGIWFIGGSMAFVSLFIVLSASVHGLSPRILFLFFAGCSVAIVFRSTKDYIIKSRKAKPAGRDRPSD